jgi:hypothetical protein
MIGIMVLYYYIICIVLYLSITILHFNLFININIIYNGRKHFTYNNT